MLLSTIEGQNRGSRPWQYWKKIAYLLVLLLSFAMKFASCNTYKIQILFQFFIYSVKRSFACSIHKILC